MAELGRAGLSPEQVRESVERLGRVVQSNAGAVASTFGVPLASVEGLIGAYHRAYADGLGRALPVLGALLLVSALIAWFGRGKSRDTNGHLTAPQPSQATP